MKATRKRAIIASPSICVPMLSSTPPDSHHVHRRITGSTYGSA